MNTHNMLRTSRGSQTETAELAAVGGNYNDSVESER